MRGERTIAADLPGRGRHPGTAGAGRSAAKRSTHCCSSGPGRPAPRCCSPGPCKPSTAAPATGAAGFALSIPAATSRTPACAPWSSMPMARGRRCRRRARARRDAAQSRRPAGVQGQFPRRRDSPTGCCPCSSFDGGYGGMVVADDGVTTVACCVRRDRLEACAARQARSPRRRGGRGHAAGASAAACARRCARHPARVPGSRPGRWTRRAPRRSTTACCASAMPPARRIRSSARA